eukprot:1028954-Pleurochrysis_carterae.AAC.3
MHCSPPVGQARFPSVFSMLQRDPKADTYALHDAFPEEKQARRRRHHRRRRSHHRRSSNSRA